MESAVNVQTYNALVCVAILDVLCGAVEDINANQDTRKILCPLSIAMRSLPSETIHQFVQLYLSQQGKTRGERPKVNVLLILLDILQFKIAVDAEGSPTIELVNLLRFCSPLFNDGKMDSTEEGETARNLKNLLSVVFSSSERCYKTMGRLIGTLARDIEEAEALFGNELALTICNSNLALIQLGLDSMDATLRDYVIAQSIQQRKLEHDRTVEPTAVQSFRHKVFVLFISQGARHVQTQTGSQEHSQFLEDYLKGVYFPSIGVPQKVQTYAQQCDTRVILRSFDSLRRHLVEHTNPPRWDMALRILAAHASDVPLLAVPTGSKKKWTPLSQEEHSAFMDKMKEIAKEKDIKKAVALLYDYERDKRVLSLSEFEMAVSVSVPRGPLVFGEHMVDYAMTCGYHSKTVGMCALNCSYRVYTKLEKMKRSRHTGAEEQQDILFKQFSCRQLALRALRLLPELYTQNVRSTGIAEIIPDEGILSESECKRLLHYIRALHNEDEQQVLHCCTEAHVFNAKVLRDARDSLYQQLKLCKMVEDTEGIVRGYLEFRNCYSRMPISSEQLLQILEACVELSSDVSKESDVVPEGGTGGDFTKREELKHVVVLLSRDAFDFLRWDAAGESTASELGKHSVIRAKFNNLVKRWFDVLFAGAVTDTGREKFTVVVVGALQAVLEHIQTVSNQLQCFDEEVLLTCVGAVKRGFQYRDSSTGLESIKNCARLLQQWSSDRGQAEALFVSKWIEKLASAQMARCSSSILILHDDLVLERHKVAREEVNNFFQHPEGTLLAKLEVMCFALQHHLCWFESSSKVSRLVLLDSAVNHVNGLLGDVASQWSPKEVLLCFHRAVSLLNSFRGELLLAEVSINGEGDVYSIHSYIMKMQTRSGDNVETCW
ncbi:hypothetical protein AGDE_12574 [Angomonas deanei]|nr:hypothetical protein AGDE_12574 [Angomonas deanei]|eukprot:EPY24155.1 hypothetical protein AGDE_12574 [Angomonas deanei]